MESISIVTIAFVLLSIFLPLGFFVLGYYFGFRSGKGENPFEPSKGTEKMFSRVEKNVRHLVEKK